jgi:hypothetical protein
MHPSLVDELTPPASGEVGVRVEKVNVPFVLHLLGFEQGPVEKWTTIRVRQIAHDSPSALGTVTAILLTG